MSVASQLYQLQEADTELGSDEQAVTQITRQLGDNKVVAEAQSKLDSARRHLEAVTKEQRSTEWEIDDLTSKLKTIEEKLYSGRIRNPKELTDLQREADELKARRTKLEDKLLKTMEQVEQANGEVTRLVDELRKIESEWQSQQKQLAADLERLKREIIALKAKRAALIAGIDPQAVAVYQDVKRQRAAAVVKVERGLCSGCRITLPVNEFQKARSVALVRCSSCGRILYLA
ncbi:MAG: hypothetical protein HYX80_04385 [Chloroflexi bacterium]|nr:hypothetical protein [Chloroflexota bacterium]